MMTTSTHSDLAAKRECAAALTQAPDGTSFNSCEECLLRPGNTNCGGCGMSLVLSFLGRALEKANDRAMLVIPACCGIVAAGGYPTTSYNAPVLGATFGAAPAFASGLAAIHEINGQPGQVVCFAGDGGTYDIGMASLSGAAERNENLIYICYDNEIYGNTGGQRSSATPVGAKTTTTPHGKSHTKKDIMAIMAAHRIPYAATLSVAHPEDFERKIAIALKTRGFKFLVAHSPCPTGWKSEPSRSVQLVRTAVRSGLFNLFEVFEGERYRINATPDGTDPADYFEGQRRFPKDAVNLDDVRQQCKDRFDRLARFAQAWPVKDDD